MSPSLPAYLSPAVILLASLAAALPACEGDPPTSPDLARATTSGDPTVSSTNPAATVQDTTLNVHVLGSGFDRGSKVEFALDGVVNPKLKVNSTKYVKSSDLLVNVTVAADAEAESYDVIVTASTGKKGIGTEVFAVLSIVDLGTPSGGYSYGRDVNSSGIVVGEYQVSGSTCRRAFVWTDATGWLHLPTSAQTCASGATAINDAGSIVGHGYGPAGTRGILRWQPDGSGSWTVQQLPDPPGYTSAGGGAYDLSESGSILAELMAADGTSQMFVKTGTDWQPLNGSSGGSSCWIIGYGVNDAGQVVGSDCVGAVIWQSPTSAPLYLPIPPGHGKGVAWDINDAGVIVGKTTNISTGKRRGCRWRPDGLGGWTYEDLGDLGGGEAEARSINTAGQVAGWSSASTAGNSMRAFLWTPGSGMRGFETLQNQNATALSVSNRDFGPIYLSGWSVASQKGSYQRAVRWTE